MKLTTNFLVSLCRCGFVVSRGHHRGCKPVQSLLQKQMALTRILVRNKVVSKEKGLSNEGCCICALKVVSVLFRSDLLCTSGTFSYRAVD